MIVLDNTVMVAFSDQDHIHNAQAREIMVAHPGSLAMHSLTVAEFLVHPVRAGSGAAAYAKLTGPADQGNLGIVVLDPHSDQDGQPWPLHLAKVRADHNLKMPDAAVLAAALASGGLVATFDKRLHQAAVDEGCAL